MCVGGGRLIEEEGRRNNFVIGWIRVGSIGNTLFGFSIC
jgi:hypothetical protein